MSAYDAMASVYAIWSDNSPVTAKNREFYAGLYREAQGVVAELGVGDGRIVLDAVGPQRHIYGVDGSQAMLERAAANATAAGLADHLTLVHADFAAFSLPAAPDLVTIPYRSFGHVIEPSQQQAVLRHIYETLNDGGRLVLDYFVYNPALAMLGERTLRGEGADASGRMTRLWTTTRECPDEQCLEIWVEKAPVDGPPAEPFLLRLAWLSPERLRTLLLGAGFAIEGSYEDFDKTPLSKGAADQVWVATKTG